jgi:ATP synthase F1 delta subunit
MTAANRYAAALFQLADAEGQGPAVAESFALLQPALADAEVLATLSNPRLLPAERTKLALVLAKAVKAPLLLANTLQVLAANNRLGLLAEVATLYQGLADAAAGTVTVRLQTAAPFTDAQRIQLKAMVKNHLKAKNVKLEEHADTHLIGGFRAFFGGSVWDASTSGNLARLAARLKASLNQNFVK